VPRFFYLRRRRQYRRPIGVISRSQIQSILRGTSAVYIDSVNTIKVKLRSMKKIFVYGLVLFAFVSFVACQSDEKNAKIEVWLTDAPGDYDEVNIEIIGVEINAAEGEQNSGWKSLNVETGVYDLLKLTNGKDTLLGKLEIPGGKISQIRLKLGDNNSIKLGDEVFALNTPSGQQSGLKLQVHQVLAEGVTYKILLDFDVARSIVTTGSGAFKLKPVIRTIVEAQNGAIQGVVTPKESKPAVYAIQNTDTVGTTFADTTGHFLLRGLPAGSYTVGFSPASGFNPEVKENVTVTVGNVTDLGTIVID
jgi:hypothetical protein